LGLSLPAGKKFLVSLYDGKLVLEMIALGFQAILVRPNLSLLLKNNLLLRLHLSSLIVELFLLLLVGFFAFLDEFLVFPAQMRKSRPSY